MKTTIYYLSVSLLVLANYATAENHRPVNYINSSNIALSIPDANPQDLYSDAISLPMTKNSEPDDEAIMNPESVIKVTVSKTIEEIIADNNQIIESSVPEKTTFLFVETPVEDVILQNNQIIENTADIQAQPLYLEKTIEDNIIEDNMIIESSLPNESYPLNLLSN